jgi:hypothetical protein
MALMALGSVGCLVFSIIILVKAFQKSVIWGLGSLFVPFVVLVFIFMNWDATKKPFLYSLGCWVIGMLGFALGAMGGTATM